MILKKGYTLLFAVLITSFVISISLSVLTIARKEVLLSGNARESYSAAYVADGAIDCAIFYDKYGDLFTPATSPDGSIIVCGKENRTITTVVSGTVSTYTFYVSDKQSAVSPCAKVIVKRDTSTKITTIESYGYNVGYNPSTGRCDTPLPQKVERAFRYTYTAS